MALAHCCNPNACSQAVHHVQWSRSVQHWLCSGSSGRPIQSSRCWEQAYQQGQSSSQPSRELVVMCSLYPPLLTDTTQHGGACALWLQVVTPDVFSPIVNSLLEERDLGLLLSAATMLQGLCARNGAGRVCVCDGHCVQQRNGAAAQHGRGAVWHVPRMLVLSWAPTPQQLSPGSQGGLGLWRPGTGRTSPAQVFCKLDD
jgi:hypothetical protein